MELLTPPRTVALLMMITLFKAKYVLEIRLLIRNCSGNCIKSTDQHMRTDNGELKLIKKYILSRKSTMAGDSTY